MRYGSLLLLFSLTLVSNLPASAQNKVPTPLQGVKRIVCMGDSITEFGEKPGGYVWLFRRYLANLYPTNPIEVVNAGISGNKSDDMLRRFQWSVLDRKPELLTLSVGVNDCWHGFLFGDYPQGDGPRRVQVPAYRANLEEMIGQAKKANIRVVLLAPTVIKENLDSPENTKLLPYVEAMRQVARKHHLLFVDLNTVFRKQISAMQKQRGKSENYFTGDGVHMNGLGNTLMAETLLDKLGVPSTKRVLVRAKVEQP